MPNNETFQIDKFQIKICEDWGTNQQKYIPGKGEPVYITASIDGVSTPIFVIGDEVNTLDHLVSNGDYYVYKKNIPQPGDNVTKTTTDGTALVGTADTWARSDHKHTLDRKITSGTELPTKEVNEGDIFILIAGN